MKLPLLPSGAAVTIRQATDGAGILVGATVWPAAKALCEHLLDEMQQHSSRQPPSPSASSARAQQQRRRQNQQRVVVELGSGTGAAGLFAAAAFAEDNWKVTLTDHRPPLQAVLSSVPYCPDGSLDSTMMMVHDTDDDEPFAASEATGSPRRTSDRILCLLRDNLEQNRALFPADNMPKIMELDWTKAEHADRVAASVANEEDSSSDGFDIVLASDVTYHSALHDALAQTMVRLLRPNNKIRSNKHDQQSQPSVCLLAHQERVLNLKGQDYQLVSFEQAAGRAGLQISQRHDRSVQDGLGQAQRVRILELRRCEVIRDSKTSTSRWLN